MPPTRNADGYRSAVTMGARVSLLSLLLPGSRAAKGTHARRLKPLVSRKPADAGNCPVGLDRHQVLTEGRITRPGGLITRTVHQLLRWGQRTRAGASGA
jgi:hypothetical protein